MMESEKHLRDVLKFLHDEIKVQHVTVLRGIEGFEKGGEVHKAQVVSLSLNLPVVVEFFDTPEQVARACPPLEKMIEKGHILLFDAVQKGTT